MTQENKLNKKIRQPIVTVSGHVDHGKCVTGDTIVPLIDGTLITAKDLFDKYYDKNTVKREGEDIIQKTNNLKLFSKKNSRIIHSKVSHLWKRKKDTLTKIKTTHGDILKTTPEHPYFVFSLNRDIETKAENIQPGDYIAIPEKIKTQDKNPKKIILENLKQNNFLCFLNENSDFLIDKIKRKTIIKLSRELSIKYLDDSIRKKRIRFQDLLKLGKYFSLSEEELYDMVEEIKNSSEKQRAGHTSKKIKLPELHNPEKFGYVLGCISGDGHLSESQVLLDNNDKEIQEKYSTYLKEIFDIDSFVKQNHTCQTVVNNAGLTFKKFVKEVIGITDNKKSQNIQVPKIAQCNKEIFKGFFSGLIDTDGYVSHINNSIELTSKSRNLIKQCSMLLLNFGIHSTVYEKKGFHYLRISNKTYLEKFLENFNLRVKKKLKRVINSSKKAQSSRTFDILPVPKQELKKLILPKKPNKVIPYFNKYIKKQNLTKKFLEKVIENIRQENKTSELIKKLLEKEVKYVKVVSKEKIKNKDKYVYDFTVPGTQNFVAERTILHNTSILDSLRGSCIQEGECGGITQKISFTSFPSDQLKSSCPLIESSGIRLDIPGFLFIDTPGHAAFTNLRKRGGSLADLAILVIDINEGIKPQTAEVIKIMKMNATPFVIALNKIDNISGWKSSKNFKTGENLDLKKIVESQKPQVQQTFQERYMTLIATLNNHGFDADLYYNIQDFSKKIAIIPTSAETHDGIQELVMMLCGLSQKYLKDKLELGDEAKGVMLEIKKERANEYNEAILHDGELSREDRVAIANLDPEKDPIVSKIRILEEIKPLSVKFENKDKVQASTGIRMQLTEKEGILPGMPFEVYRDNLSEIKERFRKQISQAIQTDNQGIIAKADSLGSLEALLTLLKQNHIPVVKASIGNINKTDIISAKANMEINEVDAIVVGFNVDLDPEAKALAKENNIKTITDDVIYKLIENLQDWREEKRKEIEKKRLMGLAPLCKLTVLHDYVFRNTKPAIFGVRVEGGKLKQWLNMVEGEEGKKVGKIKNIQSENKSVSEVSSGAEVAVSIPNINFERQMKNVRTMYTDIGENQFRNLKKNKDLLSSDEVKILQEIAEIKRKHNPEWGY